MGDRADLDGDQPRTLPRPHVASLSEAPGRPAQQVDDGDAALSAQIGLHALGQQRREGLALSLPIQSGKRRHVAAVGSRSAGSDEPHAFREPPRVGSDPFRINLIVRGSVRVEVFALEPRRGQQCRPRRDGLRTATRDVGEQVREKVEIDEDAGWPAAHRDGGTFVLSGLLVARRWLHPRLDPFVRRLQGDGARRGVRGQAIWRPQAPSVRTVRCPAMGWISAAPAEPAGRRSSWWKSTRS